MAAVVPTHKKRMMLREQLRYVLLIGTMKEKHVIQGGIRLHQVDKSSIGWEMTDFMVSDESPCFFIPRSNEVIECHDGDQEKNSPVIG